MITYGSGVLLGQRATLAAGPDPDAPRVLVAGSRHLTDPRPVRTALTRTWRELDRPIVVVHGACTDRRTGELCGADRWADEWAIEHACAGIHVERHPADWARYGNAAGPIRNRRMVARGAPAASRSRSAPRPARAAASSSPRTPASPSPSTTSLPRDSRAAPPTPQHPPPTRRTPTSRRGAAHDRPAPGHRRRHPDR